MAQHLMVRLMDGAAGGFPPRFKAQLHGTMLITDWEEMDLILYSEGIYAPTFTVKRDESYISKLSDAVEVFDYDLNELVKKIKSMGRS